MIRPALWGDLPGLLLIKPDEELHQERLFRQRQDKAAYLYAADAEGTPLGHLFINWRGDDRHPEYPALEDLLVRPAFRSQGLGTRLIQTAEALCRERGLPQIGLAVNPVENPRAFSLYQRLDYRPTGEPTFQIAYTYPHPDGEVRFHQEWCISLVKDLRP